MARSRSMMQPARPRRSPPGSSIVRGEAACSAGLPLRRIGAVWAGVQERAIAATRDAGIPEAAARFWRRLSDILTFSGCGPMRPVNRNVGTLSGCGCDRAHTRQSESLQAHQWPVRPELTNGPSSTHKRTKAERSLTEPRLGGHFGQLERPAIEWAG